MVGIWEFTELDALEEYTVSVFNQARVDVSEQRRPEASFVDGLSLNEILIYGEWGEGTAEAGTTPLKIVIFLSFRGPDDAFDDVSEAVVGEMGNIVTERTIEIPQSILEATGGITFVPANADNKNDVLFQMAVSDLEMLFNLTTLEAIDLIGGRPPEEYPRIPLSELTEDEEEVKEEAEVDDETPDIPDISITDAPPIPESMLIDVPEPEPEGPEFPDIDENLRPFAVSEDKLEIPAGKEGKEIDVREPYDFEREMALPGLQTTTVVAQRVQEEIARPVGAGNLGSTEPVGTYPRTGIYIRNYLKFREPAYSYEIYKNLVFYSAYISTLHDIDVRAGTYQSFREYMYVLERIGEEGGPVLIDALTQQQAAAQGLETIPDHPSIEGEKAPWLARRQYYTLVEENENSDVWVNPYDYLHGEEGSS